jgi:hypothetical protein
MDGMAERERRRDDAAIRITTAGASRNEDTAGRQRRYLWSMALRTACVIGAVVVGPGWFRWVLVAGAVLLPYVAVVAANAVNQHSESVALPMVATDVRHLGGPDAPPGTGDESLS